MSDVNDLLGFAIDNKPVDFADAFSNILQQKAAGAIEAKRVEYAQSMYSAPEEMEDPDDVGDDFDTTDDFEDDADLDDVDLEDLDLDDLDLDLDDIDLDLEGITDEDD
jgi:hypothetical protein